MLFSNPTLGIGQSQELAARSQRAREAMSSGDFKEAISLYKDLVLALPGQPGLRMNLGIAHYMAGQYRESIRQLEAALASDPNLTEALLFLGASRQRLGNGGDGTFGLLAAPGAAHEISLDLGGEVRVECNMDYFGLSI